MTEQPDPADTPPPLPALKLVEPKVNAEDPWGDDVLDRKEIADRLTDPLRPVSQIRASPPHLETPLGAPLLRSADLVR